MWPWHRPGRGPRGTRTRTPRARVAYAFAFGTVAAKTSRGIVLSKQAILWEENVDGFPSERTPAAFLASARDPNMWRVVDRDISGVRRAASRVPHTGRVRGVCVQGLAPALAYAARPHAHARARVRRTCTSTCTCARPRVSPG